MSDQNSVKKNRRTFNKLVRDNIPKRINSNGDEVVAAKAVKDDEFRKLLIAKATQELEEYCRANAVDEKLDNLADALEILYSLADLESIPFEEVEIERKRKEKEHGKFDDRVHLIETYKK